MARKKKDGDSIKASKRSERSDAPEVAAETPKPRRASKKKREDITMEQHELTLPILPLRGTVVFPQTVVPLALHLADQDASGVTGGMFLALQWNEEHGFGGFETWGHEEDVAAWKAAQTQTNTAR